MTHDVNVQVGPGPGPGPAAAWDPAGDQCYESVAPAVARPGLVTSSPSHRESPGRPPPAWPEPVGTVLLRGHGAASATARTDS